MPIGEPFISLSLEKVITDSEDNEIQVIGNFDRIVKKMSDIGPLPIGTVAEDDIIDPFELYAMVATSAFRWIIEKHGGSIQGTRVVI